MKADDRHNFERMIDLSGELETVDRLFWAKLASLPSECFSEIELLLGKTEFAPRPEGGRSSKSALTLLYPTLQSEPFDIEPKVASRATLAHQFFLTYTFIEDRHIDGQIELNPREAIALQHLLMEGLGILENLAAQRRSGIREALGSYRTYVRAQLVSYGHAGDEACSHDYATAADRARLGFIATETMLRAFGLGETTIDTARRAYDALVVALQWADDYTDWQDDLINGRQNLLLIRLTREGVDLPPGRRSDEDIEGVARELGKRGIFQTCFREAHQSFERACALQLTLGAHRLKTLVLDRSRLFDSVVDHAAKAVGMKLLEGL